MRSRATRAASFFLLTVIALGACGDQTKLTQPPLDPSRFIVCGPGCGGGGGGGGNPPPAPPAITAVSLAPAVLDLSGNAVSYGVSLSNGQAGLTNVTVSSSVIQGSANRSATTAQLVSCGLALGTLPQGTCSVSATASVTNTHAGSGMLVEGPATLEVDLYNGFTFLASRTVQIMLTSPHQQVTSISPVSNALIGGASKSFTVTLFNADAPRPDGIQLWTFLRQGSVRHSAGSLPINCSGSAILPTGTCTMSSTYTASNNCGAACGTLVPGAAIFDVELRNGSGLLLGTKSVNVALAGPPTVGTLTSPDTAIINGPPVALTVPIQNTGVSLTGVVVNYTTIQGGVRRAAGSQSVVCNGGVPGNLPNTGPCTFAGSFAVNGPDGTLTPGSASLEVNLADQTNGVLATQTVSITLAPPPQINDVGVNSTTLVIGGASVGYTAALSNPTQGESLPNVTFKAVVTQGASVSRTASSLTVACGVGGANGLPSGAACFPTGALTVSNQSTGPGDTGTLVAGPANLVFRLVDGASGTVLATFMISVTLQ